MFQRLIAVAATLSIVAACARTQTVPQTNNASSAARVTPDKDCGGTHGVKVTPCPIHLTRHTKAGIVVTVSGPGVVNSYLVHLNDCFNGKLCYNADREGSSQVQWRITPGRDCGAADIEFDAVNASDQEVGNAFLKSTNKYCPRR